MSSFNEAESSPSLFMIVFKKEKQANKENVKEAGDTLPAQRGTILSLFLSAETKLIKSVTFSPP